MDEPTASTIKTIATVIGSIFTAEVMKRIFVYIGMRYKLQNRQVERKQALETDTARSDRQWLEQFIKDQKGELVAARQENATLRSEMVSQAKVIARQGNKIETLEHENANELADIKALREKVSVQERTIAMQNARISWLIQEVTRLGGNVQRMETEVGK